MELGEQIKKNRTRMGLSQETLAEMIYCSRQTVSNWETSKNYPDINSLIRLSEVFGVSVDALLKGDVEVIREMVRKEDINDFTRFSNVFAVLLILVLITPIPLAKFLGFWGFGIWGVLMAVTIVLAVVIEKKKKKFGIETYREISEFLDGKKLDEISKAREEAKRPYQKILLAICCGVIALVVSILMIFIFK